MLYVRIALAALLVGALAWGASTMYAMGYDGALADQSREQVKREALIADKFVKAVAASEAQRRQALAELNELRSRPPVVITDVQKEIINRNVCRSFDSDFIRLLDGA